MLLAVELLVLRAQLVPLLRSSTVRARPWSRIAPAAALKERSKLAGADTATG
jgi:hypothetical protein